MVVVIAETKTHRCLRLLTTLISSMRKTLSHENTWSAMLWMNTTFFDVSSIADAVDVRTKHIENTVRPQSLAVI